MRKYSLIFAISCLLAGCGLFKTEEAVQDTAVESSMSQESRSSVESMVQESSESASEVVEVTLFDETLSGNLPYPKTSVPLAISKEELISAMEEYYLQEYSSQERQEYQQPLDEKLLSTAQQSLQDDDTLKVLHADIRQIQFDLAGDKIYVAQIIVPMSQQKAQQLLKENDVLLLNHTFAYLGNRLVMLAYYDEDTRTLLPVHLTNSSKPLFYYPE